MAGLWRGGANDIQRLDELLADGNIGIEESLYLVLMGCLLIPQCLLHLVEFLL